MPGNPSVVVCLLWCTITFFAYSKKNDSTFVASREWQPVKKGQPIPSGLHIRHNLNTGLTEAKILDRDENNLDDADDADPRTKSLMPHPDKLLLPPDDRATQTDRNKEKIDRSKISPEELKARLKKMKLVDNEKSEPAVQEPFESYSNLNKELKAIELNVTTDTEMLATFLQRFDNHKDLLTGGMPSASTVDDVLNILNNMEYLLHQIDNARTFADMGGMAKIISPCLNTTNDRIKAEALRLLGTAVQSNPIVQAKALEQDFVQKLLHILAVNNRVTVQSRCLFALSALVRQYPMAQKVLIDHGGLEIFGQIIVDGHVKAQSRVISLTNDLVAERIGLNQDKDDVFRRQKSREYADTNFEKKLQSQNYCRHLTNLMIKSFTNEAFANSNMANYEFLSDIIESMITLGPTCKNDFNAEKRSLVPVIIEALRHYERLRVTSSSAEDYSFGHLGSQLGRLMKTVFEKINDEL